MSTRCHVILEKKDCETEFVYHHFDGYPEGVGEELVGLLKKFPFKNWEPYVLSTWLSQQDDLYEPDEGIHGDEDYVYKIDCDNHILKCYVYDGNFDTECKIEGNVFDGTTPVSPTGDNDVEEDELPLDFMSVDDYWKSYMKIVAAMVASNEYDFDEIPKKAKALIRACVNEIKV